MLQTEVAFQPGKVAFDFGTRAYQVAPLTHEEWVCAETFALAAQIVIDVDRGVKPLVDETVRPAGDVMMVLVE